MNGGSTKLWAPLEPPPWPPAWPPLQLVRGASAGRAAGRATRGGAARLAGRTSPGSAASADGVKVCPRRKRHQSSADNQQSFHIDPPPKRCNATALRVFPLRIDLDANFDQRPMSIPQTVQAILSEPVAIVSLRVSSQMNTSAQSRCRARPCCGLRMEHGDDRATKNAEGPWLSGRSRIIGPWLSYSSSGLGGRAMTRPTARVLRLRPSDSARWPRFRKRPKRQSSTASRQRRAFSDCRQSLFDVRCAPTTRPS